MHELQRITGPSEATPDGASLILLQMILCAEGRSLGEHGGKRVDRKWILETYKECREAVTGSGGPLTVNVTRFSDEKGEAI